MVRTGKNERPSLPLAVVIGAGGIGMAVARRLGARHRLLLTDINAAHLERQRMILADEGYEVIVAACDITDAASVSALADAVAEEAASGAGGFRVLAHVAALSPSMGDWTRIMRVNLIGPVLMEQALRPLAGPGTAAIFVASMAGHIPPPEAGVMALLDQPLTPGFLTSLQSMLGESATPSLAYQHSKFALIRLCEQRAAAWGKQGARIVSLSPGLIASPMGAREFEQQPAKYALLNRTPLEREGSMIEIADAAEFLASDQASFISGTDLKVDGGLSAALRYG